jgi:hypothetical protein
MRPMRSRFFSKLCAAPTDFFARALMGLCTFVAMSSAAWAGIINIDLNAPNSPTYNGQGAILDYKGNNVDSTANNFWNGFTVPTVISSGRGSGGLLLSDGVTATGVTISFASFAPAENFPDSTIPPASGFSLLQDGTSKGFSGPVTVSGLRPNANYLFVLYGRSADPAQPIGTNFTFGGRTSGVFASTFLSRLGTDAQPGTAVPLSRRDYALVHTRANALGQAIVSFFVGPLNGMQIVGEFNTSTIFTTQEPATLDGSQDGVPYELGLRFTPSVNGQITAIRYWHPAQLSPTALITGKLYGANGSLLTSIDFPNITPLALSGWRQQELPAPINVTAGQVYVVSVSTPNFYPFAGNALGTTITNGLLSTNGAGSGVYGPPGAMPTNVFQNANYFRDVVFVPTP